jgi:phosphodiesterase/alkaline phosphatase D-like protein
MQDFVLDVEVKVTAKPVSPKTGITQRGPYERNLFVVQDRKKVKYTGDKADIAGFVEDAVSVATQEYLQGLQMPKIVVVSAEDTITAAAANLNATIDNQGVSTAFSADYGTTPALGSNQAGTSTPDTSANGTDTAIVVPLSGLSANTQYYYRIKLVSATGTVYSELKSFKTLAT